MQTKERRPKVIMIGPAIDGKGGMAEVVRNLLKTELARRYEIYYLATIVSGSIFKKIAVALIQLIRFAFIGLIYSPRLVHIHFCSGVSFYRKSIFIIVARFLKIPILLHAHGGKFDRFYDQNKSWVKMYITKIMELSNLIMVFSPDKMQWMQSLLKKSTIVSIPNIIDLPDWVSNRDRIKIQDHIKILYLGVITKDKGVFALIESIPSIISEQPSTKFIICGKGKIEEARQLSEAKKIQIHVEFTGWVDELTKLKLLNQADILILPSYYEELPYTILEGMAAGLPIAASRVGGIPSLITQGINGILFSPGNINEIVSSLKVLIDNPELREEMSKANIEKIKTEFSTEKIVSQMISVYRNLIKNNSS